VDLRVDLSLSAECLSNLRERVFALAAELVGVSDRIRYGSEIP